MYQDLVVPEHGEYIVTFHVNADAPGALVGINLNGMSYPAPIERREPGTYGQVARGLRLFEGDVLRVWMYAPSTGVTAVMDDVMFQRYTGPN